MKNRKDGDIINGKYVFVMPAEGHSSSQNGVDTSVNHCCPLDNKPWNDHNEKEYRWCMNELDLIAEQYEESENRPVTINELIDDDWRVVNNLKKRGKNNEER